MTGTVIGKILAEHLVEGKLEAGTDIAIRIDQTLTQDVTGTMAYLELEAMRVERVSVGLAVSYVDHNTAQFGPNNQNDHRYLQNMAAKLGVKFSRAGNGICHQVHLERFGVPGKTLLGSDSHTPTAGGIGAMGIGAGGLDVALAMAGEPFRMICPAVMGIELIGALSEWVTAKDVILKVLSILSTVGNTGTAVEYFGAGVASLNVPQRACITNMGAELGVTSSVFGADDKTREFLVGQDREKDYVELKADKDAAYDRVIEIDLSQLEPMIACPSSPDNIKKVSELAGTAVGQVFLGSCTNSSYQDLTRAARILKGKTVDANVSMAVSPGSRQVYEMIAANGALADLIASGCRILESACGPCIGVGFSPGSGVVSLRSNNRNFAGRSGTVGDQVYLASPEVLCTSALKGCISDPRELEMDYPQIDWPKKFLIDDRMIIEPEADGSEVDILRAETIGEPPKLDALVDELRGEVLLKLGDKITTDHISPAGQHLKWRSNIGEYAKVAFEAFNEEGQESFACRALKLKESGKCGFIVAGKSYGQGSSREHAAICPRYLGVRMVIAENFERIHSDNLINWGIIPVKLADAGDGGKFDPEDELTIEAVRGAVKDAKQMTVRNLSKGCNVRVNLELSTRQRKILLVGGRLNYSK